MNRVGKFSSKFYVDLHTLLQADFEPSNILYNAVSDEKYVSDTRHVVVVSKQPLPILTDALLYVI